MNNNNTISKIYVPQDTDRNLAQATKFGKLISPSLPKESQITLSYNPTLDKLRTYLFDYSDNDYLLLLGDPLIIGMSIWVAAEVNDGKVQVLKWDKKLNDYYPVKIDFYKVGL